MKAYPLCLFVIFVRYKGFGMIYWPRLGNRKFKRIVGHNFVSLLDLIQYNY